MKRISKIENILLLEWLSWQFYEAPAFIFNVWMNFISFVENFFSVTTLIKTLFSPWRRYRWAYPKGLDIKEIFNTFISNTFSRVIGAFVRMILIGIGICAEIFVILAGLIVLIFWFFLPLFIIGGILFLFF